MRRRLVGGALRRYRENVGYALEDAARVLECDRSKISRIETGQRGIRPKELRELLTEYGVPEREQAALVAIASRGGQRGWWHRYADVLPGPYLDYVIMESAAAEIMTYEAQVVPDLLQTDDYARAIAAAEPGYATDQQREEAVAARAARRQAILGGSAEAPRTTWRRVARTARVSCRCWSVAYPGSAAAMACAYSSVCSRSGTTCAS